jgi:hypothetical protein
MAGTVISGGFPGRVAQEVFPNQKCEGCLHYDPQGGRTGVCTIGLRPDNCGDGEAADVSYAPIARGAGSYLPGMDATPARAAEVGPQDTSAMYGAGSTRPVKIQQVSLGEEQLHVVKSMLEQHARLQKSQCLRCSMGAHGVGPHHTDPQSCSCRPIEAATIAKAIVGRMNNADRARASLEVVTQWVRDVAKAGFRLPALSKSVPSEPVLSLADRIRIEGNGGHLRKIAVKAAAEPKVDTVTKSFYSEDWIGQFKGTSLFDEARKLCEKELEMEEDDLKRRQESLKHDKARSEALDKLARPNRDDWQEQDARRTKVRIAKQRLTLKLAGLHQKKLESLDAKVR